MNRRLKTAKQKLFKAMTLIESESTKSSGDRKNELFNQASDIQEIISAIDRILILDEK